MKASSPEKAWSQWVSVAHWLDRGWNEPEAPWASGVYRFRVRPAHRRRGGEIVYVGRGGSHAGKGTSKICSRIGAFISAAMGFWSHHSGGERFFKRWAVTPKTSAEHSLSVRDLEVCWVVDSDPMCREAEELLGNSLDLPAFNSAAPRTCRRADCRRAVRLHTKHEIW
jgi:hypothetical protein